MLTALYNRYQLARLDEKINTLQQAIDSDPKIARHKDLERRILGIVLQITTNDEAKDADYELWEATNAGLVREKMLLQEQQRPLSAEQSELVSKLQRVRFERWVVELKANRGGSNEVGRA